MRFITSVITGAVGGLIIAAVAVPTQPREVEFTTTPPTIDAGELAAEYAATHGLTDCVEPADADLDDVFLTLASDPSGVVTDPTVTPVDLDAALDSAGVRVVVLACKEQS